MEIELAVLAFAGKKFAQGAIAWLGLQSAKRLFERDPEQQCGELYLEVCADAFRHFPDGTAEEADRVRDFFGAEAVAEAASRIVEEGKVDRARMVEEWVDLGGDPHGVKVYIEGFEQSFRRMAGKRLPPDLRLATSLMRSHMEDLLASKVDARETFGVTAAEEAATGAQTEVAKTFESRIDEQVAVIKGEKRYRSALSALESLEAEASSIPEVSSDADIMTKLYTNLTVCAERLGDFERGKGYANAAAKLKPQDTKCLTNLAVMMLKTGDEPKAALEVIRKVLNTDPEDRRAKTIEISMKAHEEGADAAIRLAGEYPWLADDGQGQYTLSLVYLNGGMPAEAIAAARRAAELDPDPEKLAWVADLILREGRPEKGSLAIMVGGVAEASRTELEEALEYIERAIDLYERQERVRFSLPLQIDRGWVLLRLRRIQEARELFESLKTSDDETAAKAAFANLVEALLQSDADAVPAAQEGCQRFPNEPHLRFVLGRALIQRGETESGIRELRTVAEDDSAPDSMNNHAGMVLAGALVREGNLPEARRTLEKLGDFEHPVVVAEWTRLLLAEGKPEEAKALAEERAACNWGDEGTLLVCAEALRVAGYQADSRRLFERLLDLLGDATSNMTDQQLVMWSHVAFQAGAFDKCIGLDLAMASDPSARLEIGLSRTRALEEKGRLDAALAAAEQLASEFPEDTQAVESVAYFAFKLNRPDRAVPYLERFVKTKSAEPSDLMNLAILRALAGDSEGRVRSAREAMTASPDDPKIARNFIGLMLRNGRVNLAVQQMGDYVSKFSEDDFVQVWRGEPEDLSQKFIQEIMIPRLEQHQKVTELYAKHPLPLGLMAKALGRTYIDTWKAVRGGELDRPFMIARRRDFAGRELEAASGSERIVMDQSSLLTLALLGLLSAVADAFEVVHVSQSTGDDIRDELLRSEDAFLRDASDSLKRHAAFEIASLEPEEASPVAPEVADALATQENQALILAKRLGLPLLADDLGIRDLALLHECESFGTRSFLELALSRGIIDRPAHSAAIVKLIREGHYFISYGGHVLADTIRAGDYRENDDTKALLDQIWKPDAEVQSYAAVFAVAIGELWKVADSGYEAPRSVWTVKLLTQLAIRGDERLVLETMGRAIVAVSTSNPAVLRTLLFNMFNVWCTQLRISDDYVAAAATAIARDYAVAVLERRVEAAALKAYVAALDMHWLQRVKRLMRETSPDLYPLVFK